MRKSFVKKSLVLGLSLCLVLGSAVGCGSKNQVGKGKKSSVSAEELIKGAFSGDKTSVDGSLEFELAGEIDRIAVLAKTLGTTPEKMAEFSSEEYKKEMTKMSVSVKADVKTDKDTYYVDGKLTLDAGTDDGAEPENIKEYVQTSENGADSYVYDADEKEWYHSSVVSTVNNSLDTVKDKAVNTDNFKSLKVVEKDKTYVVTGVIDYKKAFESAESADLENVPSYEKFVKTLSGYGIEEKDIPEISVVMTFDKSKNLKAVEVKLDLDKVNKLVSDMGKVSKFNFKCTFNSISNDEFEIPADIIKNAVDVEEDDDYGFGDDFSFDDDFSFGGDDTKEDSELDESMENNFGYTSSDSEFTTKMAKDWFDKAEITSKDLVDAAIYTTKFSKEASNDAILAEAAKMFNKYTTVEFLKYVIKNYSTLKDDEKKAAAYIVTEGYEVSYYITDNLSDKDAAEFDKICSEIED